MGSKKVDKACHNQIIAKNKGGYQDALKGLLRSESSSGGYKPFQPKYLTDKNSSPT